jgi:DNA transposition AAA+ family ATPase
MSSNQDILGLLNSRHAIHAPGSLHHFSLRNELISFPTFERTVEEIALLHYRWRNSGVCEGLLVFGQHGSGKSTAIKHYLKQFPRKRASGVTKIPVLLAITPETPSVVSLSDVLLSSLGDPLATRGTAATKLKRIVHFFKECGVEMLILDEFHHFYDTHRVHEGRRVSDWLKNLMNLTGICVVLVGLPRSIAALNSNPQLRRRFRSPLHHREFGFVEAAAQQEFCALLGALEQCLPVQFDTPLKTPSTARQIYYATHGLIDYVVKLLDDAVANSGAKSGQVLGVKQLVSAFKRQVWGECPDWINPFQTEKLRLLIQPREPFCDWDDPSQYSLSERTRKSHSPKAAEPEPETAS